MVVVVGGGGGGVILDANEEVTYSMIFGCWFLCTCCSCPFCSRLIRSNRTFSL